MKRNDGLLTNHRNFAYFLTGFILLSCVPAAFTALQRVNVGIYGGQVQDIATRNESGTNVLLAALNCNRGVFQYDPVSASWDTVTWPDVVGKASAVAFNLYPGREDDVYAIVTDTSNNTSLAASSSGGANGTWSVLSEGPFGCLHAHSSGLYVGSRNGELYRQQGAASSPATTLYTFSREVASISAYDENLVFASLTFDAGQTNIYRLDNVSGSFVATPLTMPTQTVSGSTDIKVTLIGVDPTDSNRLFCAGQNGANGQVYLSIDGGATWSQSWDKDVGQASTNYFPGGFPAYIKFSGNRTFISHSCLIKGAQQWTYQGNAQTPVVQVGGVTNIVETHPNDGALAVDAVDSTKIYIPSDWAIAEYSCSAGGLWGSGQEVGTNNGITGVILNDMDYYSYGPGSNKILWVAAKSGIGRTVGFDPKHPATTATPANWIFPLYPSGSPATAIAVHQTNPGIVFAGYNSGYIFKTFTGDNLQATNITWSQVFHSAEHTNVFPELSEYTTISDIKFVPSSPSNMFASAYRWQPPSTNGGVFYSNNEGVTWYAGFSNEPVNALYVSDIAVWAGIGSDESTGRGLRVRQGPSSWWNPGTGLAMDNQIVRALDGAQTGSSITVYCAADGGAYKAFLPSTGSGGWTNWIWTDLTPNIPYWNTNFTAVTVNPDDPDEVFLSAGNAILHSLDGGSSTNWKLVVGTGTISHEDVNVLKYDDLLSGTANGLYAYRDIETITVSPNILSQNEQQFVNITITNLAAGADVALDLYVDTDRSGTVSGGDLRTATYNVQDGTPNPFGAATLIGDTDGVTNGAISVRMPYFGQTALRQTAGSYLWQYRSSDGQTNVASFEVYQQVTDTLITGQVIDQTTSNAVPNARVVMEYYSPMSGLPPAVWTGTNGQFCIFLPTNVCPDQPRMVSAAAPGFFSSETTHGDSGWFSAQPITNSLATGTNTLGTSLYIASANPASGLTSVTGMVGGAENNTTNGLAGVSVQFEYDADVRSMDDDPEITAWAITDDSGAYSMPVPTGMPGIVFAANPDMTINRWIGAGAQLNGPVIHITCIRPDTLLQGIVTGSDTQAICGAEVFNSAEEPQMTGASAYTMTNGIYELGVIGGTTNNLELMEEPVLAQQYCAIEDESTIGIPTGYLIFTNAPFVPVKGVLLSGSVYNAQTNGLSDGWVGASATNDYSWQFGGKTDHSGCYKLLLTTGTYRVSTDQDSFEGYSHASSNDVVLPSYGLSAVNFFLEQSATISGSVTTGQDVVSVQIQAHRITNASPRQIEYTASAMVSNGTYALDVAAGYDYVIFAGPDTNSSYIGEYYNKKVFVFDADVVTPTVAQPASNINFNLMKGFRVSGFVTNQYGNPVAGAYVNPLMRVSGGWTNTDGSMTDDNGHYSFAAVASTGIIIAADMPDQGYGRMYYNQVLSTNMATVLTGNPGDTLTNINFQLFAAGNLQVTFSFDPGIIQDSARWRLQNCAYETNWFSSEARIENLPAGTYTTEYSTVAGWDTPPADAVIITNNAQVFVSATYTQQYGAVQTYLVPTGAITAGAQWQLTSGFDTSWHNSGDSITNLPAGLYTQVFKSVSNWYTPATQTVTIAKEMTTMTTGTYIQVTYGNVSCTLLPANAVSNGAAWRLTSGTNWFNSAYTLSNVVTGTHSLEFKEISGWQTPENVSITIFDGLTTSTTITYSVRSSNIGAIMILLGE